VPRRPSRPRPSSARDALTGSRIFTGRSGDRESCEEERIFWFGGPKQKYFLGGEDEAISEETRNPSSNKKVSSRSNSLLLRESPRVSVSRCSPSDGSARRLRCSVKQRPARDPKFTLAELPVSRTPCEISFGMTGQSDNEGRTDAGRCPRTARKLLQLRPRLGSQKKMRFGSPRCDEFLAQLRC